MYVTSVWKCTILRRREENCQVVLGVTSIGLVTFRVAEITVDYLNQFQELCSFITFFLAANYNWRNE